MINPLSQQELDHLAEVREVWQTTNTAGWHRIRSRMQSWVTEALEDMRKSPYASNETKAALQMRWSQRESMLMGIDSYIADLQYDREMLLQESKVTRSVPAEVEFAEQD
jgi:hypothetical protein